MKKKQIKISTAIPAELSGFVINGNSHLSSAKLKVFHTGLTSDGRNFTAKFAEKIAATIGGTPVVARYDEEEEDFKGHHHSQSVFGFVPEQPVISFETEGDSTWLVTEVRLFTERHDVGRIARKIIGQPQSLELDPESVQVDFIYGEDNELERMDFQDGNLIGLSVLGLNQSPAFTGSGFFSKAPEADELEQLIAKYNTIPKELVIETGGELMDKKIIFETDGFVIYREGDQVFVNNVKDGAIDNITDALNEEAPDLPKEGDEEETVEEVVTEEAPQAVNEAIEPETAEDPVEEPVEAVVEQPEDAPADASTEDSSEGEGEAFESEENTEEPAEELEPETEESASHASSLSEAERNELENYRRADKINIIDGYSEYLSEAQLQEFKTKVDEFEIDNLEKELSFASMQALKNKSQTKPSFSFDRGSAIDKDPVKAAFSKYI